MSSSIHFPIKLILDYLNEYRGKQGSRSTEKREIATLSANNRVLKGVYMNKSGGKQDNK